MAWIGLWMNECSDYVTRVKAKIVRIRETKQRDVSSEQKILKRRYNMATVKKVGKSKAKKVAKKGTFGKNFRGSKFPPKSDSGKMMGMGKVMPMKEEMGEGPLEKMVRGKK
jgi:hypothetical protein